MKNLKKLLIISLAVVVACVAWPKPQASEEQGTKNTEAKSIPLESMYSNSGQDGLKPVLESLDKSMHQGLEDLFRSVQLAGCDLFLARGDDIGAAVRATSEVFNTWQRVDEPARGEWRFLSSEFWLVAYLGNGGASRPELLVQSVHVKKQGIRLRRAARDSLPS